MTIQLLVIAKEPVPGRVKTRLCPPCTPAQAAAIAAAALDDTIETVGIVEAIRRTLVLSGEYESPPGWATVAQRGHGLGERLVNAFRDTAAWTGSMGVRSGAASLLIGMDTPQVTVDLLGDVACRLGGADAVLGPAQDGGWWVLALRDPDDAVALLDVPMSTKDTGRLTLQALHRRGLVVRLGPSLRDVDTVTDALIVAEEHPDGHFAAAVRQHMLGAAGVRR